MAATDAPDPDEPFPLSAVDDHLIHQTIDPIRVVWTSDLQAYERHWMTCHDDRELIVCVGGSFYPNLDAAEAFAIVNLGGSHTTVRAFRRLGRDRMNLAVGPIRPTVVEGLRHWRFELDENDWGISFDLHFRDVTRSVLREPIRSPSRLLAGRQPHVTAGFETFGDVKGWVRVGGRRLELSEGQARGTRDRHWGTGRAVGGPGLQLDGATAGHSGNTFVRFRDLGVWGDRVFYPLGDPRPGAGRVVSIHRRVRFEEETRIFSEAIVDYTFCDGSTRQAHFERIGDQTAYLRCGMYGGTPDGLRHQGLYPGVDLVEGEVHDVSRPEVRSRLAGLDEHLCWVGSEGERVVGIFQPVDTAAYDACVAGRRGWEFL